MFSFNELFFIFLKPAFKEHYFQLNIKGFLLKIW